MIAAIDKNGTNRLLMNPDSGEHSGEVRFLEDREIGPDKLESRVFPFLGQMRALMLMTDGVSDDYFPNDPGMSLLYGDLVLNGIIANPTVSLDPAVVGDKSMKQLGDPSSVDAFSTSVEAGSLSGIERVRIRSVKRFAETIGKTVSEVLASPEMLARGAAGDSMCGGASPDKCLQVWLDSYQVRGSFDDRTLLVLHQ
jgi:hypothetical protein